LVQALVLQLALALPRVSVPGPDFAQALVFLREPAPARALRRQN
jgi:hypothetical protein